MFVDFGCDVDRTDDDKRGVVPRRNSIQHDLSTLYSLSKTGGEDHTNPQLEERFHIFLSTLLSTMAKFNYAALLLALALGTCSLFI